MYDHEQCWAINFYYVSIGFGGKTPALNVLVRFHDILRSILPPLHLKVLILLDVVCFCSSVEKSSIYVFI